MFEGWLCFGYNEDGYGDYNMGLIANVEVEAASNSYEALEVISNVARKYCEKSHEEEEYEIPYPWNWGDVFNEVDDAFFAANGICVRELHGCGISVYDETVVAE